MSPAYRKSDASRVPELDTSASAAGFPGFRRALLPIPPLVDLRKLTCGKRESKARKTGRNCPESGKTQ
jgi:hypothetical protein